MTSLRLTDEYSMAIERHEKKARLVIYKNDVENVCRKEKVSEIERFISSEEEQSFKGRLQLHKHANGLRVEVKGDSIGLVEIEEF